jgi:predicted nucleic acid-binding protein
VTGRAAWIGHAFDFSADRNTIDLSTESWALDLAARFSLPASDDACYLALAERLGGEFWTADRRLVQAVQMELGWVRLVEC